MYVCARENPYCNSLHWFIHTSLVRRQVVSHQCGAETRPYQWSEQANFVSISECRFAVRPYVGNLVSMGTVFRDRCACCSLFHRLATIQALRSKSAQALH